MTLGEKYSITEVCRNYSSGYLSETGSGVTVGQKLESVTYTVTYPESGETVTIVVPVGQSISENL